MTNADYKDVNDILMDMDNLDDLPDLENLDDLPDLGNLDDLPSLEDLETMADFSDLEADAKAAGSQLEEQIPLASESDSELSDEMEAPTAADLGLTDDLDALSLSDFELPEETGLPTAADLGLTDELEALSDLGLAEEAEAPSAAELGLTDELEALTADLGLTEEAEAPSAAELGLTDELEALTADLALTEETEASAGEDSAQPEMESASDELNDLLDLADLDALDDAGIDNAQTEGGEFSPENIDEVLESLDMGVSVPLQTEDNKEAVGEDDLSKLMEEYSGSDAEVNDLDSLLAMMEQEEDDDGASQLSLDDIGASEEDSKDILALAEDGTEEGVAVEVPQEAAAQPEKKKGFFARIFGNIVNDEIIKEEQEAAAKEAEEAEKKAEQDRIKKEEAQAKKEQALEEKKAQKEQKKAEKDAKKEAARAAKAAAREARKAEEEAEAALEVQGKLNKTGVSIVAVLAVAFVLFVILGTMNYGYRSKVKQSEKYFGMKKYTKAYEEIQGVKVKEKDAELYNKIITVMYVNREIDSYNIFTMMKKYPEALDALLKGLENYDANLETAEDLEIMPDMDYCKAQILESLQADYGLSEQEAKNVINSATSEEYSRNILDIVLAAESSDAVN